MAGTSDQDSTELDFALARYNSDGSLDTSFDEDGLLTTDFNSKVDFIASIAIQSDGKIVVAGDTYYPGFLDRRDIAIARYLSDGALDTSFGSGGKREIDLTPGISLHFADEGQSIALGTDGRIVVAGFSMIGGNYKSDLFLEFLYNPCVLLLLEGDSDQTPELDVDNDSVLDLDDNCQFVANPDQSDFDGDGLGDVCDADPDGDSISDGDNCPYTPNPLQEDNDGDGFGDVCDDDDDNDGIADVDDNCPLTDNPDQADLDGDNIGDACDIDIDGDGIDNDVDNCPMVANIGQDDTDLDGHGDACDDDDDNDGVLDIDDNCSLIFNPDQSDFDNDGQGDVCDGDLDGDGVDNEIDNCPTIANGDQNDWDGDRFGDVCDDDFDDDGVPNYIDECDFTPLGEVIEPSTGCAIEELVPCEGPRGTTEDWKNHGKYVSTLAKTLNSFVEEGLITEEEKDAIMSEGASSDCGNK